VCAGPVFDSGSELIHAGSVAFHDFEDPFLGDFVLQCCLDDVVPRRDGLFGPHCWKLAVERIPAISGAGGSAARSGDAAGGIVEVTVIASAEGRRAARLAGGVEKRTQGNHELPPR